MTQRKKNPRHAPEYRKPAAAPQASALDGIAALWRDPRMTNRTPGLADAYALRTPDDNRRLYADWAATYDQGFAGPQDYLLPGHVARAFAAMGGTGPVLDIGAGTGLVGEFLAKAGIGPVDGIDISPEMLDVARRKGCYRSLVVADVTAGLKVPSDRYQGVVSSGTFTLGHLGPAALDELVRIAAPGAPVAISVYEPHYFAQDFAAALDRFAARIARLANEVLPIYGPGGDDLHRDHRAVIVRFRKRG